MFSHELTVHLENRLGHSAYELLVAFTKSVSCLQGEIKRFSVLQL